MDTDQVLGLAHMRPGTLGLDGSFGQAVAFLQGVDAAQDGGLLVGLREWLTVRIGDGANLAWPALIVRAAFPERVNANRLGLSSDDNKLVVDRLFGLLNEFRNERNSHDGLLRIFDAYAKWMRSQDWYAPGNPSYLDGS